MNFFFIANSCFWINASVDSEYSLIANKKAFLYAEKQKNERKQHPFSFKF